MSAMYPIPTSPHYYVGTQTPAGWPVWAVQRAINRFHESWNDIELRPDLPNLVDENFIFGGATETAVKRVQSLLHLTPTGVCDPATMRRLVKYFTGDVGWLEPSAQIYRERYKRLPAKLLVSIAQGESNYELGCASWNGSDNVDLGVWQDNIQGSELLDETRVKDGFDVRLQASKEYDELVTWYDANVALHGCVGDPSHPELIPERTWRRAALNHNWPVGAFTLARNTLDELSDSWLTDADWVTKLGVHLPDGTPVRSQLDWVRFYSLGFPHHNWNGLVCRQVTSWTPQG